MAVPISVLAIPLIGGAVAVNRFSQLFPHARNQGHTEPLQWARAVRSFLLAQGQKLLRDGVALDPGERTLALLTDHAAQFAENDLMVMQGSGSAEAVRHSLHRCSR